MAENKRPDDVSEAGWSAMRASVERGSQIELCGNAGIPFGNEGYPGEDPRAIVDLPPLCR